MEFSGIERFKRICPSLILSVMLSLLLVPAVRAQEPSAPPASIPVEFSKQERDYILQMCEAAKWAARVQFDGCGDQLRAKFLDAERKAAPATKPEK